MTLLDIVQKVMSRMSLEEINSIEDVPESVQIAELTRDTYNEIISHRSWEFLKETFSLTPSGSSLKPTIMTIPESITDIEYIKYLDEEDSKYKEVKYLDNESFLELCNSRRGLDNTTQMTNVLAQLSAEITIFTDRQPEFYTTFDQETVVFDAYNTTYDTTLQSYKSLCYGTREPTFLLEDAYVIDMPSDLIWSYLLPEVRAAASYDILQTVNEKDEQKSRRGRFRAYHSNPKTTDKQIKTKANFGRN